FADVSRMLAAHVPSHGFSVDQRVRRSITMTLRPRTSGTRFFADSRAMATNTPKRIGLNPASFFMASLLLPSALFLRRGLVPDARSFCKVDTITLPSHFAGAGYPAPFSHFSLLVEFANRAHVNKSRPWA